MPGRGRALKKLNNHRKHVEFCGEVRAADLDDRSFSFRLDDGTKIVAPLNPEQEEAITEALRGHATRRLRLSGHGEIARNRKIKRLISVESVSMEATDTRRIVSEARPIWEVAVEIGAGVPEKEWAKVPKDGAKNLRHYLYGAPKEK
jgi:hypothetical protein